MVRTPLRPSSGASLLHMQSLVPCGACFVVSSSPAVLSPYGAPDRHSHTSNCVTNTQLCACMSSHIADRAIPKTRWIRSDNKTSYHVGEFQRSCMIVAVMMARNIVRQQVEPHFGCQSQRNDCVMPMPAEWLCECQVHFTVHLTLTHRRNRHTATNRTIW